MKPNIELVIALLSLIPIAALLVMYFNLRSQMDAKKEELSRLRLIAHQHLNDLNDIQTTLNIHPIQASSSFAITYAERYMVSQYLCNCTCQKNVCVFYIQATLDAEVLHLQMPLEGVHDGHRVRLALSTRNCSQTFEAKVYTTDQSDAGVVTVDRQTKSVVLEYEQANSRWVVIN